MCNSPFPGCNRNRENIHAQTGSHRRPHRSAQTTRHRLRHTRRQAPGFRRPGAYLGPQTLLRPLPASRSTRLEDVGDAATMDISEARSLAADMLAAIRRGRKHAPPARRDRVRSSGGGTVPELRTELEGRHPQGQPDLLPQPDPALVRRRADRRDHAGRRSAVVRLPPRKRRRPQIGRRRFFPS